MFLVQHQRRRVYTGTEWYLSYYVTRECALNYKGQLCIKYFIFFLKRIKLFIFILLSLGYHYTCIIVGVNLVTLTILHVVLCHFAWTEFTAS